jgi:putative transcriptional regulator
MTKKKITEENRIFDEMLEMAQALQGHALISKQDMAKMKLICQNPTASTLAVQQKSSCSSSRSAG